VFCCLECVQLVCDDVTVGPLSNFERCDKLSAVLMLSLSDEMTQGTAAGHKASLYTSNSTHLKRHTQPSHPTTLARMFAQKRPTSICIQRHHAE
jgi:hypothetical protein